MGPREGIALGTCLPRRGVTGGAAGAHRGEHVTSRQLSSAKSEPLPKNQAPIKIALIWRYLCRLSRFDPKVRLNGGTIWSLES